MWMAGHTLIMEKLFFRRTLIHFGVKVLCIEPGFFKTTVTDAAVLGKNIKMLWNKMPQEVRDDYGSDYLDKGKYCQ